MGTLRRASGCCLLAVFAVAVPACEIENPVEVTVERVDPRLLTNGAVEQLNQAFIRFTQLVMIASDEARWLSGASPAFLELERSGDLRALPDHVLVFQHLSHARELTGLAIETARQRSQPQAETRARLWYGWTLLRSAEIFGDQPIRPGGEVLAAAEIVATAEESFRLAIQVADALSRQDRHRALAGMARSEWHLGRDAFAPERLRRAAESARAVLAEDPAFSFAIPYLQPWFEEWRSPLARQFLVPNPHFQLIPQWWTDPRAAGAKLIDADELHLIVAEAHLLHDELPAARAALKATPLLARNHVGIVRQRVAGEPPLTTAEVDAYLAALDRQGIRHAIEELRREAWYGHGRRNLGPSGPLMPAGAPAGAW